jgi:integrase
MKGGWTVTSIHNLTDGGKPHGKKYAEPSGVEGLCIFVRGNSRIYQFRYNWQTKPKTLSIGSIRKVELADARAKARKFRNSLDEGRDPAAQTEATLEAPKPVRSFRDDTLAYHDYKYREWDATHATLWLQSMEKHAFPLIGGRDTATLTVDDIVQVITPLWTDKHETAIRLHGRIRAILEHAADVDDHGRFTGGNPADRAPKRLPRGAEKPAKPHAALPWRDAPELYERLRGLEDRPAYALRFLLLCCCPRTAEVIGAKWTEIDLSDGIFGDVWHIAAQRMKSGSPRDIPLPRAVVELLSMIRPIDALPGDYIFRANRQGRTIKGV